jgi:Flp pilus assembly protein TadB
VPQLPLLVVLASALLGLAAAGLAWTLLSLSPAVGTGTTGYADELRTRLIRADPIHRYAGRLVDELVPLVRRFVGPASLQRLEQALEICGRSPPWTAERLWAAEICRGLAFGGGAGLLVALASPLFGVVAAGGVAGLSVVLAIGGVETEARKRSAAVRGRLAFATDLMALVLQAGGSASDALESVVRECGDHPLGQEFGKVADNIGHGMPRKEALARLRDRFADVDIRDFVFAVVKGEELGTPLAEILSGQARDMRRRQSQACEKQAAEAEVKLSFPSMLVLVACLIVMLGPFLLPLVYGS